MSKHEDKGSFRSQRTIPEEKGRREGILETFSLVAMFTSVRVLFALAAAHNQFFYELDINNAFRHGDLHEQVYMQLPLGYSSTDSCKICKLQASLSPMVCQALIFSFVSWVYSMKIRLFYVHPSARYSIYYSFDICEWHSNSQQ